LIPDSAVESSAPRSGERQPLDKLGALSLSKRQADFASTAEFRLISLFALLAQLALPAHAEAQATPSEPPAAAEPIPGLITGWELSPAVRSSDLAPERYLDGQTAAGIP